MSDKTAHIGLVNEVATDTADDMEIYIKVKALVMVDKEGNYFIHGTSNSTSSEMFNTMLPLWSFNPEVETLHTLEFTLAIPNPDYIQGAYVKS